MPTLSYRCLLAFLCFVSTVQADVLLEKIKQPGYVMPSYAISSRCTLSNTGLLTTKLQLGELISKRNTRLQLTTLKIQAKINEAALGKITTSSFPVDPPTVTYRAYQKQSNGSTQAVLLYEENGGSGVKSINNSEAATLLRNFIDLNCGDSLI